MELLLSTSVIEILKSLFLPTSALVDEMMFSYALFTFFRDTSGFLSNSVSVLGRFTTNIPVLCECFSYCVMDNPPLTATGISYYEFVVVELQLINSFGGDVSALVYFLFSGVIDFV